MSNQKQPPEQYSLFTQISVLLLIIIVGGLVVFSAFDKLSDGKISKVITSIHATKETNRPPKTVAQAPIYETTKSDSAPIYPKDRSSNDASHKGVVYLHVVNKFQGTDKRDTCNGVLDENSHTLELSSIDNPISTFKLIYQDNGFCTFQYYSDGALEAQKEVRRRSDLETGDGTLVYTSRTGEITISLSYE